MVTIDEIPTWAHRAIVVMLYLNNGEISKQKLNELLYLIYKELENIDPLEDLDFYVNLKTKEIEIFTPSKDINIEDIISILSRNGLINNYKGEIYLTDYGYKVAKAIMNDPEFKNEVNTVISVLARYKDYSEGGLINLILEDLKHS